MRDRRIHIAIAFVWALAHGVWMGAGMHSFSDVGARLSATNKGGAPSCAGCQFIPDAPQADSTLARSGGCAVCELSTVLPEAASIPMPVISAAPAIFAEPISFIMAAPACVACELPPAHAPPA
jgi:hypothetical protein